MKHAKLAISVFLVALGVAAVDARAAFTYGCVIDLIAYDDSPRMEVVCSGQPKHWVFGLKWTDCKNAGLAVSGDAIKVWHSMLQAALLSGRKVDLAYETKASCQSGERVITSVALHRQ
jgi:hypothetical protein